MTEMLLTFQGADLVVPKAILLQWGLQPGDSLVIHPVKSQVEDPDLLKILDELRGSWSQEDEEAFYKHREEMWGSWKPRS